MSVELFWDCSLLCILRKGIGVCPCIYMSMDNWPWKYLMKVVCWVLGMDVSHPFQLFISVPPLWIFEPWEHANALLTDILLIQPNSLKKNIQLLYGLLKVDWRNKLTGGYIFTKKVSAYPNFLGNYIALNKTKLENPHLTVIRENASCSVFCLLNKSNYVVWDLPVGSPEADFLLLSKFPAFICSWNSACQ